MADKKDYIPEGEVQFDGWSINFAALIVGYAATLGIPPAEITNYMNAKAVWDAAWAVGGKLKKGTRNQAQVKAKDSARDLYEGVIRNFVKRLVSNNLLANDEIKVALRVNVPDGSYTRKPKPDSKPICTKAISNQLSEVTVVMECTYSKYRERKKTAEEYQNSINSKTRINSAIRSSAHANQIMNDNSKCRDYKDLVSKV